MNLLESSEKGEEVISSMRDKLEQELKCPKKFWKSMKRMNAGNKKRHH